MHIFVELITDYSSAECRMSYIHNIIICEYHHYLALTDNLRLKYININVALEVNRSSEA